MMAPNVKGSEELLQFILRGTFNSESRPNLLTIPPKAVEIFQSGQTDRQTNIAIPQAQHS